MPPTAHSPQIKIKEKLRDIERQRRHLSERLTETNDDLSDSARLIEACLKLLENLQALYRRCDDEQRRLLNQAIFHGLYVEDDQITGHDLKEPFAQLHAVQTSRRLDQRDKPDQESLLHAPTTPVRPPPTKEAALLLLTVSRDYSRAWIWSIVLVSLVGWS